MKILLIVILFISSLFSAKLVEPREVFKASGRVVDIVHKNDKLYAATNAGCVDVFDMKTKEIISKIKIDPITDFMGDVIESKVYSVDLAGDRILLLSQDKKGYRRVHIFEDNKGELIISYKDKLSIAKAKFIDENNVLFALLSNELISYDIKNKKENWTVQVSGSKFSNFVLSEDKSEVVVADESGDLKIHSTKDGSFIKKLSEQNLDNVFQVDYKNSIIATAGQDRRVVIYDLKRSSAYYKSSDFLSIVLDYHQVEI